MSLPDLTEPLKKADPDVVRTLGLTKSSRSKTWARRIVLLLVLVGVGFAVVQGVRKMRARPAPTFTYAVPSISTPSPVPGTLTNGDW